MSDLRLTSKDSTTNQLRPVPQKPVVQAAETGKIGTDQAAFSAHAREGAHGEGGHGGVENYPHGDGGHGGAANEPSAIDDLAHGAHNPHGALHAVEATETLVKVGARVVGRASRAAAVAAEVTHHPGQGHHGLLGKLEHAAETFFAKAGNVLGAGIRRIPGGGKVLDGLSHALGAPGRVLGPGLDKALLGTRVGQAAKFTGSGGRLVANMGGRIPVIGALLGGVIAVADARSSLKILNDPKATTTEKVVAGSQGGLSVISGVAGVGALGVAAAAAIGLTAPVSVPVLLAVAAVTGIASFALSFFKKSAH